MYFRDNMVRKENEELEHNYKYITCSCEQDTIKIGNGFSRENENHIVFYHYN